MKQAFTHLPHHIAHEELWFSIRTKHYAPDNLIEMRADGESANAQPLTHFVPMPLKEKRISGVALENPVSFFSPSIAKASEWTPLEWRAMLRGLKRRKGWTTARFNMLTPQQATQLERHASQEGLATWTKDDSFWIVMGGQCFETYKKSRRSSFNRNQGRCRRHMDTKGFSYSHDLDFEKIVGVYKSRAGQIESAEHPDDYSVTPKFHAFVKELREAYKAEGRWYECGVMKGDELCAFVYGFFDKQGVFYIFQTCHNPEYHSLRLGAMAFEKAIEDALGKNCKYVSFTSDSHYFAQFTTQVYSFKTVEVFSRSPKAIALYCLRNASRAAKAIKCAWVASGDPRVETPAVEGAQS